MDKREILDDKRYKNIQELEIWVKIYIFLFETRNWVLKIIEQIIQRMYREYCYLSERNLLLWRQEEVFVFLGIWILYGIL